ncbi:phage antirepressor N-terminal domain-containing protein [Haemophilus haemolyticus]|uniref:ORF6C domain-containing protein n=1 Tax=Haemophilus haemolyticus TaxID=726 RepID=A0A852PVY8_HAEHA|nr:phage antirepressor N-terminal domain-containing protein [Haemophilus haemolyticus]NYA27901.1 ORF6C domain-containing protein [Haemophilus haemolyticus]
MSNQISTQTISFNHQSLVTFKQNGTHYTAMKPICENIGLDWKSQYSRMKRDDVLNSTMVIITIVAEDGKKREMICLPIEYINGWLFGIDINRCKPEIRDTLIKYKKECYQALHDYWFNGKAERTINPEQQQAIQEAVVKAHHRTGMSYAEIYRQLKSLFKVGKYDQLKPSQFEGAINFLTTLGNSYAPIDRMDNLELTEQEWLDWQNFYYAVTRFSESVEILMSVLRPFRSHQQSSVEFNLDVVQRYIRTTNPAVRKINDRINCTNRRPLAIGHYNESATSVAVFK